MAEFNLQLLDSEINDFLKQIHVVKAEPSSTFLAEIVSGIVELVPFQNITMLTGPRHRPSEEWITQMLRDWEGYARTKSLPLQFAERTGFDVPFVSSTILERTVTSHSSSLLVMETGGSMSATATPIFPTASAMKLHNPTGSSNTALSKTVLDLKSTCFQWSGLDGESSFLTGWCELLFSTTCTR